MPPFGRAPFTLCGLLNNFKNSPGSKILGTLEVNLPINFRNSVALGSSRNLRMSLSPLTIKSAFPAIATAMTWSSSGSVSQIPLILRSICSVSSGSVTSASKSNIRLTFLASLGRNPGILDRRASSSSSASLRDVISLNLSAKAASQIGLQTFEPLIWPPTITFVSRTTLRTRP